MNETDIKKCIKHGYCWSSYGDHPTKRHIDADTMRNVLSGNKSRHATKREAQLAISTRREQARVDARKADPEPPMWKERPRGYLLQSGCTDEISLDDGKTWKPYDESGIYAETVEGGLHSRYESPTHVAWRKRQEAKKDVENYIKSIPIVTDTELKQLGEAIQSVSVDKETCEQRDARLKAAYEGYCNVGGPITKEQLTEEMLKYLCEDTAASFYTTMMEDGRGRTRDVAACFFRHMKPTAAQLGNIFWTFSDAEHDHFLRTWRGPLTEEAAKKLHVNDTIYVARNDGTVISISPRNIPQPLAARDDIRFFLSKSEAKAAAHDLWLADRRENQLDAITEEQQKMLHNDDVVYIPLVSGPNPLRWALARPNGWKWDKHEFYFSEKATQAKLAKAAQAALDKAKQPERKFAEIPSWCPPLPDGYVPLGFGGTFKTLGVGFAGLYLEKSTSKWRRGDHWNGDIPCIFYAAPRDSEIAILNYLWLKDEGGDKSSPTEKPREWTDIPQNPAPRKPTLAEAFNIIIAAAEANGWGVSDLHRMARQFGLKIRAVEGGAR